MEQQNGNIDNVVSTEEKDEYVTYEDLSADRTQFVEKSCEQFIKYCQNDKYSLEKYEERLQEAKESVNDIEENLRFHGRQVHKLQNRLRDAKLDLDKIKNSKPIGLKGQEVLTTEWEAIKNMRGVTDIYYDEDEETLCIDVAVRVPYKGEVYDFGDYSIKIHRDEIECPRNRSGVREDWKGGYPDYCYDDGDFCLGDREGSITKFISEQRLREAIILVIDCLHSVNDEEEAEDIPNCFRRIVPPKEG